MGRCVSIDDIVFIAHSREKGGFMNNCSRPDFKRICPKQFNPSAPCNLCKAWDEKERFEYVWLGGWIVDGLTKLYQREVTITYLKIFVHIIAVIGVVVLFLNLKGYFINKDRVHIYRQLLSQSSNYRVSVDTPGVNDFLAKYYYSKKIPDDMRSQVIKGLVLKWIGLSNNPPMSGTVHVEFENSRTTTSLCRLDELKQWSMETPFYSWLAGWLVAISVITQIIIIIFDSRLTGRKSNR